MTLGAPIELWICRSISTRGVISVISSHFVSLFMHLHHTYLYGSEACSMRHGQRAMSWNHRRKPTRAFSSLGLCLGTRLWGENIKQNLQRSLFLSFFFPFDYFFMSCTGTSFKELLLGKTPLWTFMWFFSVVFLLKPSPHTLHLNGLSPVWIIICALSSVFWM